MAMTMRVTNMAGRVIATKRNGVRSYHQHDALGNTIALINDSAVVTDTYTYWPYGEIRTSTGTTANPFKFCGAWGYYTDSAGRMYVRARYYRPVLARWQTKDCLWPGEDAYKYVDSSPSSWVDSSGLAKCEDCCCCPTSLTFANVRKIVLGPSPDPRLKGLFSGAVFDLVVRYLLKGPDSKSSSCQLKWEEMSNIPYMNANGSFRPPLTVPTDKAYTDLFALKTHTAQREQWERRDKQCAGDKMVTINDTPGVFGDGIDIAGLHKDRGFVLCFKITLIASCTDCKDPEITKLAKMSIKADKNYVVTVTFDELKGGSQCKLK